MHASVQSALAPPPNLGNLAMNQSKLDLST